MKYFKVFEEYDREKEKQWLRDVDARYTIQDSDDEIVKLYKSVNQFDNYTNFYNVTRSNQFCDPNNPWDKSKAFTIEEDALLMDKAFVQTGKFKIWLAKYNAKNGTDFKIDHHMDQNYVVVATDIKDTTANTIFA